MAVALLFRLPSMKQKCYTLHKFYSTSSSLNKAKLKFRVSTMRYLILITIPIYVHNNKKDKKINNNKANINLCRTIRNIS